MSSCHSTKVIFRTILCFRDLLHIAGMGSALGVGFQQDPRQQQDQSQQQQQQQQVVVAAKQQDQSHQQQQVVVAAEQQDQSQQQQQQQQVAAPSDLGKEPFYLSDKLPKVLPHPENLFNASGVGWGRGVYWK